MAVPLMLLGLSGVSTVLSGAWMNKKTLEDEDLDPQMWGTSQRNVVGGMGLAGLLLGGPMMAPVGMGLLAASVLNYDTTKRVKTGMDALIAQYLAQMQVQPQIPQSSGGGELADPRPALPLGDPQAAVPSGLLDRFAQQWAA